MFRKNGKAYFYFIFMATALGLLFWYYYPENKVGEFSNPAQKQKAIEEVETLPGYKNLDVPYVSEAPDGNWTGSWKNGCEEAVITMVENYYKGLKTLTVAEAKAYMQILFTAQQKIYGSDANSDAKRTKEIIENFAIFGTTIIDNPTLDAIRKELSEGRPVIAFHNGFELQNKNIPLLPAGSGYHTTVIKGYDDSKNVFIVHDDGDTKAGADHLYGYDLFINSLHDYQYATGKADGLGRVLFTFRKK